MHTGLHGREALFDTDPPGLASRLGDANVIQPSLDASYDLAGPTARLLSNGRERMDPAQAGHPDWHNDASRLLLDINDALSRAADAKSRAVVLRRLRRALEDEKT